MSFTSVHFLFLFFPVVLFLYYLLPSRGWRSLILVISSLVFFAWADPQHLHVLLASVLFNYFFGIMISHARNRGKPGIRKLLMWAAVIINILILGFYKYLGLLGESIFETLNLQIDLTRRILPLGISYFTFSGISYIMDVYHGSEKPERNVLRFTSFLVMFPKLLQGPITRYKDVKNELLDSKIVTGNLAVGVRRLVIGLAKKVILANSLAVASEKVFSADPSRLGAGVAWFGLIAFTLEIYFDFSGYTDMALGIGQMLGFKLPENFNQPYSSRSITEFWRRWHMSLTSWFRTYVFIPLEFARKRERFLRQQTNILIVFLLTGLWHGAGWNFVIWGGYFGLLLALEASGLGKWLKKLPVFLQHSYALILIMLGWVFFRVTSIADWGPFLGVLTGGNGWSAYATLKSMNIFFYWPIMLLAILFCIPGITRFLDKLITSERVAWRVTAGVVYAGLFITVVAFILTDGFTAFMYAQF